MKITIINTSDKAGGAAIASNRLFQALLNSGHEVAMLVNEKKTEQQQIKTVNNNLLSRKIAFLRFALERLYFYFFEKNKSVRFAFSPGIFGTDISKHPLVRQADIIHLHWINFGFLSLKSLKKLFVLGKPVVWTFHDMWAFTGGCHYALHCTNFHTRCHNCLYLKNPGESDLSTTYFEKKKKLFSNTDFSIITCSSWLKKEVLTSHLLKNKPVFHVPNLIDLNKFKNINKQEIRRNLNIPVNRKLVLFGAMNVSDIRKGFNYFKEALEILFKEKQEFDILLYGKSSDEITSGMPYQIYNLGQISSQQKMVETYNAADVFVIPSIQDNLPNTIVEAHACGTPVVGFNLAGISEMIEHKKNGYLARPKSATDLAAGISWVLNNSDPQQLPENARAFAEEKYNPEVILNKHLEVYQQIIDNHHG